MFKPTHKAVISKGTPINPHLISITACGPSLKPVILHWFPNFFGSTARTGGKYAGNTHAVAYGASHVPAGAMYGSAIRAGETNSDAFEMHCTTTRGESLSKIEASDDDDSEKGIVAGIMRRADVNVSYSSSGGGK